MAWRTGELYSARPPILGTYVASLSGDYEKSVNFGEECLLQHSKNFTLRNNHIISLLELEKTSEAVRHHNIQEKPSNETQVVVNLATEGRINFALKNSIVGHDLYKQAFHAASKIEPTEFEQRLRANYLYSMAKYEPLSISKTLFAEIEKTAKHKLFDIAIPAKKALASLEE